MFGVIVVLTIIWVQEARRRNQMVVAETTIISNWILCDLVKWQEEKTVALKFCIVDKNSDKIRVQSIWPWWLFFNIRWQIGGAWKLTLNRNISIAINVNTYSKLSYRQILGELMQLKLSRDQRLLFGSSSAFWRGNDWKHITVCNISSSTIKMTWPCYFLLNVNCETINILMYAQKEIMAHRDKHRCRGNGLKLKDGFTARRYRL